MSSVAAPEARAGLSSPLGELPRAREEAVARPGAGDVATVLAVAVFVAAVAIVGAGGLELSKATPVELLMTLTGAGLAAVAIGVGAGPRRMWGGMTLTLLAAYAVYVTASIAWSQQPSDTWVEANRTLSYLAAFTGAIALVRLGRERWRALLGGVLLGLVLICLYGLITKVFPGALDEDAVISRLRAPFEYWNAIGIAGAMVVPPALWLGSRREGSPALNALAYPAVAIALVTIFTAYSRGSLLALVAGGGVWFLTVPRRLRGAAVLLIGALGAASVMVWALFQDGFTEDRLPTAIRDDAGHELGFLLLVVAVALWAVGLAVGFLADRRTPSPHQRRRAGIGLLAVAGAAPIALLVALALSAGGISGQVSALTDPNAPPPSDGPDRLTQTGSVRARYWRDSVRIWESAPLIGTGAGAYYTLRARHRQDAINVRHAHGWVPQTLADLGLLGLALSLALAGAWLVAAARAVGLSRGPGLRLRWGRELTPERAGLLTLVAVAVTFGVHSLVDWTWFIPGVVLPALLCAGWVAGSGPLDSPAALRRGVRPLALAAAALVAVGGLVVCWAIWQPLRSQDADRTAVEVLDRGRNIDALEETRAAERYNPLSIEPLVQRAQILESTGHPLAARHALERAVRRQPGNPEAWRQLADFELNGGGSGDRALAAARAALFLDPRSQLAQTQYLLGLRDIRQRQQAAKAVREARIGAKKAAAQAKGGKGAPPAGSGAPPPAPAD